MLFTTRAVAYRLLPTHAFCRFGGSCSCTKTTVPADALSEPAVAAGPTTRLAATASAAAIGSIERLRMSTSTLGSRGARVCAPLFDRTREQRAEVISVVHVRITGSHVNRFWNDRKNVEA